MSHGHDHHASTPAQHDAVDAWHDHSADAPHQAAHGDKISAPVVIGYGVVGFLIIAVATVATIVYFNYYNNRLQIALVERADLNDPSAARIQGEYEAYRTSIEEAEFGSYGWVNADANRIRIPLEKAIDRVVTEYQAKAPAKPAK